MPSTENFFEEKKPWSEFIKDRVLKNYLTPYLGKLQTRPATILIIDAFAGPGKFDDGTPGSPLIICDRAKKYPEKIKLIFMNKKKEHHERLQENLEREAHGVDYKCQLGDSNDLLRNLSSNIDRKWTVFLYIDPFGLQLNFNTLLPFLDRTTGSTELLINLNTAGMHRVAGRDIQGERQSDSAMTRVLGNDSWRQLFDTDMPSDQREKTIVDDYMSRLTSNGFLKYCGACSVNESRESHPKYYLIYATSHPDGLALMNDVMVRAKEAYNTHQEFRGTLFENMSWRDWRDTASLEDIIVDMVRTHRNIPREELWFRILKTHFLRFTESEFKAAVKKAYTDKRIDYSSTTGKLNDKAELFWRS